MKSYATSAIVGVFAGLLPLSAIAAECDFEKVVGSCEGRVEILSSGGTAPDYSAELRISSSASTCSKVEYYLDSTPNVTILKSKNSEQESLFGTKPITSKTISVHRCTAYASIGEEVQDHPATPQTGEEDPFECLKRFKTYLDYRVKNNLDYVGLAQYCPL